MTDVAFAAPVVANLYPATVRDPSGAVAYSKVRVIITPAWLVVYDETADVPGGRKRPYTALKVESRGARPGVAGSWVVNTESGEWNVAKRSGCGCGSALKTMPSPAPLDL